MLSSIPKHDRIPFGNQTHNMLHTLLYFLALLSLSTSANLAKWSHMPSQTLGFWRLGIAAALLAVWVFAVKRTPIPRITKNFGWVLLSGFFFFLHLWTFKYAAKNTSISHTMIIFSSNPVWASLGAVAFFNEKLSSRLVFSYILALLGVFVLVSKDINLGQSINYGDWSSLVSAMLFALYMLTGKKARHHYDNNFFSLVQYSVCALLFGLGVLATGVTFTGYDEVSWLAVIGLVLIPTFLGHFTFTYLVKYFELGLLTCGKLIEPVFASILAFYMFGETLTYHTAIAFLLTAVSLLVLFFPVLKRGLEGNR